MTRGSKSSSSSSSSMDQSSSKAPITQLSSDIFDGFLTPGLTNQEKLNLIRANYDLVKQIKSLDFSNTDINNEDLARIFIKINNLEEELATSSSIGTSPKKQINTINLENCRSIKPGFLKNFNSPYLKKLNLTWVELTKEDFLTIRNNFPNLETISCSVDNITELWQNQKGEELDEIKDLMCYFLAKLEEVYFSIFSSNSKIRVLMDDGLVFNKLKTIEVTTSLSGSGLNKLLNSTSGNIETLRLSTIMASSDLSNLNLEDEKLSKLKTFDLSCSVITGEGLNELLNASFNNLESLSLTFCKSLGNLEGMDLKDKNLGKLKTLDLSNSDVTSFGLNKLLHASFDSVETLYIVQCKSLGNIEGLNLDDKKLDKLKILDISTSNISGVELNKLLHASNDSIEALRASYLGELGNIEGLNLEDKKLDKLKDLDFSMSNITGEGLNKLLNASLNSLENLDLTFCKSPGDLNLEGLDLKDKKLSKLKVLNLSASKITDAGLSELLNASLDNLEVLNIDSCESLENLENLNLEGKKLTKLKTLNLSSSNLTGVALNKLLNASLDNLETLIFRECQSPENTQGLNLENTKLSKLKTLNFFESVITGTELNKLLNAAIDNLEVLILTNCNSLESLENLNFGDKKLSNLKELYLSRSDIDDNGLNKLLDASLDNLKTLKLSFCKSIKNLENLNLREKKPSNLRDLDLSASSITVTGLNNLLNRVYENLESLDLEHIESLKNLEGLDLEDKKLSKLKVLDLSDTDITETGLKKLLRLAPDAEIYSDFSDDQVSSLREEVKEELRAEELRVAELLEGWGELGNTNIGNLGVGNETDQYCDLLSDAMQIDSTKDNNSNSASQANLSTKRKADNIKQEENRKRQKQNPPSPNPISFQASNSFSSSKKDEREI